MRKKIVSVVLASALTLSLGTSAMAGSDTLGTGAEKNSTGADVNAKIVEDDSISATVSWGDMNFIYREAGSSWEASGNGVSVVNHSKHKAINVSYYYSEIDEEGQPTHENPNGFSFYVSGSGIHGRGTVDPGSDSDAYELNHEWRMTAYGMENIAANGGSHSISTIFRYAADVAKLTGEYAKVGVLTIEIWPWGTEPPWNTEP